MNPIPHPVAGLRASVLSSAEAQAKILASTISGQINSLTLIVLDHLLIKTKIVCTYISYTY